MKESIHTEKAPAAIGPYSQATTQGSLVFCSGQIPLTASGELLQGSVAEQTEQVMKNLAAVLEAAGSGFSQVLKTTVYLTDMADFAQVNEVYGKYFSAPFPARACIAVVGLPKGVSVEIEAIALRS